MSGEAGWGKRGVEDDSFSEKLERSDKKSLPEGMREPRAG